MKPARVLLLAGGLGLAGWIVFGVGFTRRDAARIYPEQTRREETLAAARDVARRFGVDTSGWGARVRLEPSDPVSKLLAKDPNAEPPLGLSPLLVTVQLSGPGGRRVFVELGARDGPTAVHVQDPSRKAEDLTPEEARRVARGWLSTLLGPGRVEGLTFGETTSGTDGKRVTGELPGAPEGFLVQVEVIVRSRVEPRARVVVRERTAEVAAVLASPGKLITGLLVFVLLLGQFVYVVGASLTRLGNRRFAFRPALTLGAALVPFALLAVAARGLAVLAPWDEVTRTAGAELGYRIGAFAFFWESLLLVLVGGAAVPVTAAVRPAFAAEAEAAFRGRLLLRGPATALLVGLLFGGLLAGVQYLVPLWGLLPGLVPSFANLSALGAVWPAARVLSAALLSSLWDVLPLFGLLVPRLESSRIPPLGARAIGAVLGVAWLSEKQGFSGDFEGPVTLGTGLLTYLLYRWLWKRSGLLATIGAAFAWKAGLGIATLVALRGSADPAAVRALLVLAALLVALGVAAWRGRELVHEAAPGATAGPAPKVEIDRVRAEMELARSIQERMLRRSEAAIPGFEVAGLCRPARDVGGDLYTVLGLPAGRSVLAVADVSGKGLSAALFMTLTKGLLLGAAEETSDPAEIAARVNAALRALPDRRVFVTAVVAVVDATTRRLAFVRAGHTSVLVRRAATGDVEVLRPGGLALGMAAEERFERALVPHEVGLCAGDVVVVVSDGVTEAMNPTTEEYGDERLLDVVRSGGGATAEKLRDAILADVSRFVAGAAPSDDLTVLVLRAA